jgi:hypothetical protein
LKGVTGKEDEATLGEAVLRRRGINPTQVRLVDPPRRFDRRLGRWNGPMSVPSLEERIGRGEAARRTVIHDDEGGTASRAGAEAAALVQELASLHDALARVGGVSSSPDSEPAVRRRAASEAARLRGEIVRVRQAIQEIGGPEG